MHSPQIWRSRFWMVLILPQISAFFLCSAERKPRRNENRSRFWVGKHNLKKLKKLRMVHFIVKLTQKKSVEIHFKISTRIVVSKTRLGNGKCLPVSCTLWLSNGLLWKITILSLSKSSWVISKSITFPMSNQLFILIHMVSSFPVSRLSSIAEIVTLQMNFVDWSAIPGMDAKENSFAHWVYMQLIVCTCNSYIYIYAYRIPYHRIT